MKERIINIVLDRKTLYTLYTLTAMAATYAGERRISNVAVTERNRRRLSQV